MAEAEYPIARIEVTAAPFREHVAELYRAGRVWAVDGSKAYEVHLAASSVYACTIAAVCARQQEPVETHQTQTLSHDITDRLWIDRDNLLDLAKHLDAVRQTEDSWTRTFREYLERQKALELIDAQRADIVLIDGPLFTQNLLTQAGNKDPDSGQYPAAKMLDAMMDRLHQLIGFIKNDRTSSILDMVGLSLIPGEFWVCRDWRGLMAERFQGSKSGGGAINWINASDSWVRVVYRLKARHHVIECGEDYIPTALAILLHDPSMIQDHEIPALAQLADSKVRGMSFPHQITEPIRAAIFQNETDIYCATRDERDCR